MMRRPHSHDTILQGMSIYHPKYRYVLSESILTKIIYYKDLFICIMSEPVNILFLQKLRSWQGATNGIAAAAPAIYNICRHGNVRLDNVTHFFVRINQALLLFCFFMQQHELL